MLGDHRPRRSSGLSSMQIDRETGVERSHRLFSSVIEQHHCNTQRHGLNDIFVDNVINRVT